MFYNKRLLSFLLCFLLSLSGLSGAGQNDNPGGDSTVFVEDAAGHQVPVPASVKRIVCINSGLSVLVAALGLEESVVGRDANSTFPHALKSIYAVASNSSSPNIELILEKKPDLVLADNMLPDRAYEKLTSLGISVAIYKTSDPREFEKTITGVGQLTGSEKRAQELIQILNSRISEIDSLVNETLKRGADPQKVFFENRKPYSSASARSGSHIPIVTAGGVNIAEKEPVSSPKLSAEYVLERNPDVIVRRISGDGTAEVLKNIRDTIMIRPGLEGVRAVQDDRVYMIKADLFLLLRYPVGLAYMASWFYPEILSELNPEEFHKSLIEDLFGPEEWNHMREVFVYP